MELNFDKEIDAILRKGRKGENAFATETPQAHLDADTLAAFAENALPEKAKLRSTAHLADCGKCRKILSNLILLNAETESEIVHAEESIVAAPVIPWYRKLFAFPNLTYSLGALALVFGGLIAFTVMQSLNSSKNAALSQMSNKALDTKSAPVTQESNSSLNTANSATNPAVPANSVYSSNTAAPHSLANSNSSMRSNKTGVSTGEIQNEERKNNADDLTLAKTEASPFVSADKNETVQEKDILAERAEDNESRRKSAKPQNNMPSATAGAAQSDSTKTLKRDDAQSNAETTSVGGKTFRREGAAWVDTVYQRTSNLQLPSLTRVTRGSSEYKNLDGDLRKISDRLSGVVIIVWKSRAYRIQ